MKPGNEIYNHLFDEALNAKLTGIENVHLMLGVVAYYKALNRVDPDGVIIGFYDDPLLDAIQLRDEALKHGEKELSKSSIFNFFQKRRSEK